MYLRQPLSGIPTRQGNVKMGRMCCQFQTRPATVHLSLPGSCPAVTPVISEGRAAPPLSPWQASDPGWPQRGTSYFNCGDDCQGKQGELPWKSTFFFCSPSSVLVGVSALTFSSRYVYRNGEKAGGPGVFPRMGGSATVGNHSVPCPVPQLHQQ